MNYKLTASELRLGNWIMYEGWHPDLVEKGHEIKPYPTRVKGIEIDIKNLEERYAICGDCERGWEESFYPIPLTPEILEKAAFKKIENKENIFRNGLYQVFLSKSGRNSLFYVKIDSGYWYLSGQLYYLHQLQNIIFALTGTELKIEL